MVGAVTGFGIEPVLKVEKWREFVYKCVCAGITEEQIEQLELMGMDREKIYELLSVGKDCGTCIKGESDE